MAFFWGSRVCKTAHANWSNWSRPCWLHVDRLATTAIGISSMHSRVNQSLHFFCWLVNGSKSPNPKDCVGTLHFAHAEHAHQAVEKYNRGILEVSHLFSKSIVGYGGYGSSIRNLWWPTAVFCQQVADQCYGSIMIHHQHLKLNIATRKPSKGKVLFWTPGPPVLEGYMLAMYGRKSKRGGWWNYAIFIYSNILKFNW